jgi:hypothetical protein
MDDWSAKQKVISPQRVTSDLPVNRPVITSAKADLRGSIFDRRGVYQWVHDEAPFLSLQIVTNEDTRDRNRCALEGQDWRPSVRSKLTWKRVTACQSITVFAHAHAFAGRGRQHTRQGRVRRRAVRPMAPVRSSSTHRLTAWSDSSGCAPSPQSLPVSTYCHTCSRW